VRGQVVASVVGVVALVAAGVLVSTGRWLPAVVLLAVAVAGYVLAGVFRRRAAVPPPDLRDEDRARLRTEREAHGEVAAIRTLRQDHPGLGLADAARMVREL
jgi:hypothetical protein